MYKDKNLEIHSQSELNFSESSFKSSERQFFITWVPFQRRSISMQSYFGYDLKFLSFSFKSRLLRPLEYFLKAWVTLRLLIFKSPQILWVQFPPTPLIHVAFLYKVLFNRKVIIIADCHNATFRNPWITFPGTVALLNRCNLLLIHNDSVTKEVVANNISCKKLYILEDPPAFIEASTVIDSSSFPSPWILCPCSFNTDEPIKEILEAACLAPEITFVLTGKVSRAKGIHDLTNIPQNVKLPGFLPKHEFDYLLRTTDAILGLTKIEGIQLSVAGEAVGVIKPMIISNTKILKELFYKGATYVNTFESLSIAQGCREAILRKDKLTKEVKELNLERKDSWLDKSSKIEIISNLLKI